jgi:hypothetical protein
LCVACERAGNIAAELQALSIMALGRGVISILFLSALPVGKTPYQLQTLFAMKGNISLMLAFYPRTGQHGVTVKKTNQHVISCDYTTS